MNSFHVPIMIWYIGSVADQSGSHLDEDYEDMKIHENIHEQQNKNNTNYS